MRRVSNRPTAGNYKALPGGALTRRTECLPEHSAPAGKLTTYSRQLFFRDQSMHFTRRIEGKSPESVDIHIASPAQKNGNIPSPGE